MEREGEKKGGGRGKERRREREREKEGGEGEIEGRERMNRREGASYPIFLHTQEKPVTSLHLQGPHFLLYLVTAVIT